MSHTCIGVIVPQDTDDIDEYLERIMAPYDEGLKVEPYTEKCYCVGHAAEGVGQRAADLEHGDIESRRVMFHALPEYLNHPGKSEFGNEDIEAMWQQFNKDWQSDYKYTKFMVAQMQPNYQQPNPNCDSCHGTGEYETTYNPKSTWDWWVIGGRWDGEMAGIERKSKDNGFNFGDEHHQRQNNSVPVAELADRAEAGDVFQFYAIVTPDGKWNQRGKMGWWGMSSDEMPKEAWRQMCFDFYRKYAEGYDCLSLDVHI